MSNDRTDEHRPRRYLVRHPVGDWIHRDTPDQALQEAAKSIWVGDTYKEQYLTELRERGETTITYGFAMLLITSEMAP